MQERAVPLLINYIYVAGKNTKAWNGIAKK